MLSNWLVIGYDRYEEQVFWDVIPAKDEAEARDRFDCLRQDYAVIVDAMPASALISVATRCQMSVEQAEKEFREIENYQDRHDNACQATRS